MPGTTIGTKLNPLQELAWGARIQIQKTGREYKAHFQLESGDDRVSRLVHEHIDDIVKQLNQSSGPK